jgi:hypothetical protein
VDQFLTDDNHRRQPIEHDHQQLHVDQQLDWSSVQSSSRNDGHLGHSSA